MNIKLNGYACINNDDYYFEDFEVEIDEDIEVPFDDIDYDEDFTEECSEDCDGNCYDCEYGEEDEDDIEIDFDLTEDERFEDYSEEYINLLSKTVREIYGACGCPACISEVLDEFLNEYLEG